MKLHWENYYWENYFDEESAERSLRNWGFQLCDMRRDKDWDDVALTKRLKQSYPTYVQRPFLLFQYGNCMGYTDEVTYLKLKREMRTDEDLRCVRLDKE